MINVQPVKKNEGLSLDFVLLLYCIMLCTVLCYVLHYVMYCIMLCTALCTASFSIFDREEGFGQSHMIASRPTSIGTHGEHKTLWSRGNVFLLCNSMYHSL